MASSSAAAAASSLAYIEGELESHACTVCYEVMEPPERSPMLLFPCGHTLCKSCLAHHLAAAKNKTCAMCRTRIESQAVNISLQQLIVSMSSKRAALRHQQAQRRARASNGDDGDDDGVAEGTDVSQYIQQYHQYSLRCAVLQTRLRDLESEHAASDADLDAARLVHAHLAAEETNVLQRLAAVQAELDLVRAHLATQESRQTELLEMRQRQMESREHIERILGPLERDRDKAELIVRKLAPTVKLVPQLPTQERRERTTTTASANPAAATEADSPSNPPPSVQRPPSSSVGRGERDGSTAPLFSQSPLIWTFPARPGR